MVFLRSTIHFRTFFKYNKCFVEFFRRIDFNLDKSFQIEIGTLFMWNYAPGFKCVVFFAIAIHWSKRMKDTKAKERKSFTRIFGDSEKKNLFLSSRINFMSNMRASERKYVCMQGRKIVAKKILFSVDRKVRKDLWSYQKKNVSGK